MEGRDSDVRHEGRQMKRSHAEESVNTDNDDDHNHSINSRKRRAMDGRLDTVMEIDLSVNLDEEKDDLSESEIIRKKPTSNLIHSSDQVQRDVEKEEEGEPMEAYEGIHDHEKPSLRASASVSDSELVDKSKLESLHIEVGKMREENQKLKSALSDTMNNYQSLQMHLQRVMQQGQQQENNAQPEATPKESKNWEEESKLVSLSLGINPSSTKATKEETAGGNNGKEVLQIFGRDRRGSQDHLKGFSLSLDVNDQETSEETNKGNLSSARSPTKSDGGLTKSETADLGPESGSRLKNGVVNHCQEGFLQSNKAIKASHDADENSEAATRIRKARVSVRARCEAPTMIDGCHWRKYGQKIAKGNPCPRAYYRCTVVPGCPVRKQVQRCPDDMAILISTYEGSHNHPLPIAATAMASTTEAAVSMLLSGSSSSLEAMNANNPYMSRLDQSFAFNPTISTSAPFPTITLDLTDNPTSQLDPRSSVAAGGSLSTSFASTFPLSFGYPSAGHNVLSTPHHPNTILSSKHSFAAVSSSNPWNSNHLYYAQPPHQQAYSRPNSSIQTENHDRDRQMFHSQHQTSVDSFLNNPAARAIQGALSRYSCQTLIQNVMSETYKRSTVTTGSASSAQHSLADTVTAATAAITSDPNFTTALVNAVASIISSQGTQSNGGGPNCDKRKWGEPITDLPDLTASYPPQSNTLFSATS